MSYVYNYDGEAFYCVRTLKQDLNILVSLLLTSNSRTNVYIANAHLTAGCPSSKIRLLNSLIRRLTINPQSH